MTAPAEHAMTDRPAPASGEQEEAPISRPLALLAIGLVGLLLVDALLNAQQVFSDWHAYYRAAANLRAGADLYAEAKILLERNSYDYWVNTDGQYVYPPLLALVLLPFTALDIGKAGDLWLGVLALALAGFLGAVGRLLGHPLRPEWLAAPALAVLPAVPLLLGIRYGQVDLPLLLLTTLALLASVRGREALAGLALGMAAAVKPTIALYGLYFLRKQRWVTLATAALTALLLGLGPLALLGSGALADWLAVSRYFTGSDYPSYPSNQSLRGLLLRAFAGGPRHTPLLPSPALADGLWLLAALAALALWWRCLSGRPEGGPRAAAEYALTAVLILFAAPLSEDIHYVVLLLPLAVLAARVARRPPSAVWAALAGAACLYYAQPWLDFAYNRGGTDLRRLLASGAYLYGLLPVGLALILLLRGDRQPPAAGHPREPAPPPAEPV